MRTQTQRSAENNTIRMSLRLPRAKDPSMACSLEAPVRRGSERPRGRRTLSTKAGHVAPEPGREGRGPLALS
eukprot:4928041-Alexandrium_andersonii.AAC.1